MEFELSVALLNKLLAVIDKKTPLAERLSEHGLVNGKIVVPGSLFDIDSLEKLHLLAEEEGDRPLTFQIIALRNLLSDKEKDDLVVPELHELVPALSAYFSRDAIDGWLYKPNKDGVLLPWLIDGIEYVEPTEGRPYVAIMLLANTVAAANKINSSNPDGWRSGMTNAILFYRRDVGNLTIPDALARKGFFKECPEFKQDYELQSKRFLGFQPRFGQQFVARNSGFHTCADPIQQTPEFFRIRQGTSVKCINDEEMLERRFETHTDSDFWKLQGSCANFNRIPLHCYLYMFHLELHRNIWVHVQNLTEYHYKPELRTKLVLPPEHRTLIDILTSKMDVLTEDIIEGKSGGTTILCMGASGLGKTLTAEVYSEVVGKPLYRVHSGHLGVSAESVEAALTSILRRAARWDAILLLDEADVYIRRRDNDLQHNAIVAEFLRTLEYFDGLLFMTTNRVDDVDDAILSRCIAVIKYEVPPHDDAIRLWKTLSTQFQADLSDEMISELVSSFPSSSGRDIKELIKLTSRFCSNSETALSMEAFRQCAVFRGKV